MADIENPPMWVGALTGRSDVTLVLHPGTPEELRIHLAPLVMMSICTTGAKYAQQQLDKLAAAIDRHGAVTRDLPRRHDA